MSVCLLSATVSGIESFGNSAAFRLSSRQLCRVCTASDSEYKSLHTSLQYSWIMARRDDLRILSLTSMDLSEPCKRWRIGVHFLMAVGLCLFFRLVTDKRCLLTALDNVYDIYPTLSCSFFAGPSKPLWNRSLKGSMEPGTLILFYS